MSTLILRTTNPQFFRLPLQSFDLGGQPQVAEGKCKSPHSEVMPVGSQNVNTKCWPSKSGEGSSKKLGKVELVLLPDGKKET